MTIPALPDMLRYPMRQGYQRQAGEARRFTAMDVGRPQLAGRVSAVETPVALTLDCSAFERGKFWLFFEATCQRGSLVWTMPDPTRDGWPLLRASNGSPLTRPDGRPITMRATWLCMFDERLPSETIAGIRFRIAFGIWVLPK